MAFTVVDSHDRFSRELPTTIRTLPVMSQDQELVRYQRLLTLDDIGGKANELGIKATQEELKNVPLVRWDVKQHMENESAGLQQYAVMGKVPVNETISNNLDKTPAPPVLLNTNSPWSAFLCGSQGSGKSHALSCMLENCLLDDPCIGKNPRPLAGIVFHYDRSQAGDVCEAAYLCSRVPTKVLVSASSIGKLKKSYNDVAKKCGAEIGVAPLELHTSHLNTERIKLLMAVGKEGDMPLYMSVSGSGVKTREATLIRESGCEEDSARNGN